MVFSSPLFLSLFLPVLLLVYAFAQERLRNAVLLAASLLFYSWGEPKACLVMLGLIVVNYISAIAIDRSASSSARKWLLALAICANLSALFFYKYLDFTIGNINSLLGCFSLPELPLFNIALPIGISFYCFQAMSYTIDVYRKEVDAQYSLARLALYISLFPQLIAGPIVRYSTICGELNDRSLHLDNVYEGTVRFCIGLAKKVFIADTMGYVADQIFVDQVETIPQLWAWVGCVAYTLQIYYDFSAYSDMAIGLGRIFNFHFLENFNFPYSATSIKDFWRRWHISLSSWLRDYLYIPLGGNRISVVRTYLNQFIVFFLCGLWHGASWNFAIWGVWHGSGLILERFVGRWTSRLPAFICNLYVLLFVMIGWVFFRSPDLGYACDYQRIMFFGNHDYDMFSFMPAWANFITISNGLFMLIGIIFAYPIQIFSFRYLKDRYAGMAMIALLFVATYVFAMTSTFSPFIYFRF